jgi:Tfp pilus assembly protein PilN
MLRLNLATRPFYNERAVHITLAIAGIALAALCAVSAWEVVSLSASTTALETALVTDRARANEARQAAERHRAEVRQEDLQLAIADAREANTLIDRRTFSWTELFNHLEATLPAGVMLQGVHPSVTGAQITIQLRVIAREVDDIDEFMERLEETGAFGGMLVTDESRNEEGTLRATLVGRYTAGVLPSADGARKRTVVAPVSGGPR